MTEVYLVSAARAAIGSFGGALKDQRPGELAAHVAKAAIARTGIAPDAVQNFVLGNVIHTEPRDVYAARIAAIGAGIPRESPAHTVNRLCGSGLQAIIEAAQPTLLGDAEIAVGAGAEILNRAPSVVPAARGGPTMGEAVTQDGRPGGLPAAFKSGHAGGTDDKGAARYA